MNKLAKFLQLKNRNTHILLLSALLIFILPKLALSSDKEIYEKIAWDEADLVKGKKIYEKICFFCHSINGDGKNWVGYFITPHPRNFTNKDVMKNINRERMFYSVLNGRPGTAMPTWRGLLTIEEIRNVIVYINKKFVTKEEK